MAGDYRYIGVFHYWFIQSKGHEAIELGDDLQRARELADHHLANTTDNFKSGGYAIVRIGKGERLLKPRKLTWRERLTGKIDQTRTGYE